MTAPRLELRLDVVGHNTRSLVGRLGERGIQVTAVTKSTLGSPAVAATFLEAGAAGLADSRVSNIRSLRSGGVRAPMTLLRSPMPSEVDDVVALCDVSCNTELVVLALLSAAAVAAGVEHGVLLMVELGDLREGIMPDDVVAVARGVCELPGLTLAGLGTNLACRSGVVPDETNMATLSELAVRVEAATGTAVRTVSGGNSANLGWALGTPRPGRITELRLGEALLLGKDPLERRAVPGLRTDAVTLIGEVIESGTKPSMPWGDRAQTAFGEHVEVADRGAVVQTIVALGRQDTDPSDLEAPEGVEIVASSSDHLVTRTTERLEPGTEMVFRPGYSALLRAMTSPTVAAVLR